MRAASAQSAAHVSAGCVATERLATARISSACFSTERTTIELTANAQVSIAHDPASHSLCAPFLRLLVRGLALLAVLASIQLSSACGGADAAALDAPVRLDAPAADPVVFAQLPDFALIDQRGGARRLGDWSGRPFAFAMIFTSCAGPCPELSAAMRKLQDELPAESKVALLSVTVDPRTDTPHVLAGYAHSFGADEARWTFLTGDEPAIHALIRGGFKLPVDAARPDIEGAFQPTHSNYLVAVDKLGRVRGYYDGRDEAQRRALLQRLLFLEREDVASARPSRASLLAPPSRSSSSRTSSSRTSSPPQSALSSASAASTRTSPSRSAPEVDAPRAAPAPQAAPDVAERSTLPSVNAGLNATASVLLLAGLAAIKRGERKLHERLMYAAACASAAFLACYLYYHFVVQLTMPYRATGLRKQAYLVLLLSHTLLAIVNVPLVVRTFWLARRADWPRHARLAKWTFPIWLYVSITGVIVYALLYHWNPPELASAPG